VAAAHGCELVWLEFDPLEGPSADAVAAAVGERTALVSLSHVDYRSAAVADMAAVGGVVRSAGGLMLWDLSHTAGSVSVALDADGADLAVGCTYKYLNAGPGAPAFMYARRELLLELRQPIWGWLGRRDPFAMAPGYEPAAGVTALLSGTPPVLGLACVEEGVRLVAEAGMAAIRAKGMALTSLAVEIADERLASLGVGTGSPREAARRGAHVALTHREAERLSAALMARGVIVDFRGPDVIRVGLSPLTTRFVDVWDGLEALRQVLVEDA
jgi:kynureninase